MQHKHFQYPDKILVKQILNKSLAESSCAKKQERESKENPRKTDVFIEEDSFQTMSHFCHQPSLYTIQ